MACSWCSFTGSEQEHLALLGWYQFVCLLFYCPLISLFVLSVAFFLCLLISLLPSSAQLNQTSTQLVWPTAEPQLVYCFLCMLISFFRHGNCSKHWKHASETKQIKLRNQRYIELKIVYNTCISHEKKHCYHNFSSIYR